MMPPLDSAQILDLLPHRYPFLLVDRVEVVEPGRRVVGHKRVTANEWWMEGAVAPAGAAAPPTMPHALVLEALAQTSGALVRDLLDAAEHAVAYFMAAERVRMRRLPAAGDTLRLELTLRSWRRGICRSHGVATVGGALVLSADLTTVVRAG
ncbi:MAG: 3-hydroxyacyl-[acyl-carrier-protein] dehydratase FabZ [Gemmatimonadota bacterium]|nr:3-hydroxyacyl-[acyl-carrier-protein] dehydratase FabZ [Gemmatimonadota bacterium]